MNLADAAATAALARQKKQPNVSLLKVSILNKGNTTKVDDLLNNLEAENDATPEVENNE